MKTSRRLLLYGLKFFLICCIVRGAIYVPPHAIHFPKCNSTAECPANSTCKDANSGDYCKCDDNFYNDKDRTDITYPGGECLENCKLKENPSPCACRSAGFLSKLNENGLYECTDKCKNDTDCPPKAFCKEKSCCCYNQQEGSNCTLSVKMNGVCPVLNTTISPLLTSTTNMENTSAYTQPGSPTLPIQPDDSWLEDIIMAVWARWKRKKKVNDFRETVTLVDRCQTQSSNEQEMGDCEKRNDTGPVCTFLKSIVDIKEEVCDRDNTNTSVKKVADQISDLLNRTSLANLDFSGLEIVFNALIENVETSLLESFSTDLRNQEIRNPEIEVEMKVSPDNCKRGSHIILKVHGNQMEVPCSLVNFGGAMLILYKGLNSRLNGSILAALGDSAYIATEEVISPVVGGAITSPNTENLDPHVTLFLKHLTAVKPSYSLRCVFWDTKKKMWSTHGCETQQSKQKNSTICACTHLSTFAVIMAPTKIQVDAGLRMISLIGLSISLVFLCLSFLTFLLCQSLRSVHTSILMVLCGCLFLGQLLLLVGLEQTWNKILCSVIAGSLQFLFLCAFCWMSLESILLFLTVQNLQAVNYMNSLRYYFLYVCLIGFGIPVIIMIVSASVYPDIYGDETHCWLKISHIWSFLGPVCLFMSVNFTLLVLTFWLLRNKLTSLNANVSTLQYTRLLTFKALSQLFILGCTWIIGLFQFGSGSLVASYIFTVCNSLQGVFIFLVHCLLNRKVQEEYSQGFRRLCSKKSTSDTAISNTVPMTMKPIQSSNLKKQKY